MILNWVQNGVNLMRQSLPLATTHPFNTVIQSAEGMNVDVFHVTTGKNMEIKTLAYLVVTKIDDLQPGVIIIYF